MASLLIGAVTIPLTSADLAAAIAATMASKAACPEIALICPRGWLDDPGGLDDFNDARLELRRIGCIDASHLNVQAQPTHDVLHHDTAAEHDHALAALRK
ncbi:hypothetical protein VRB67_09175 [Pseudomonas trivialis]|uniref:hypothetical protein n=1 Tax=Pseudomonas trivialis TaxID=200450 RepID=UPI0030CB794C